MQAAFGIGELKFLAQITGDRSRKVEHVDIQRKQQVNQPSFWCANDRSMMLSHEMRLSMQRAFPQVLWVLRFLLSVGLWRAVEVWREW